MFRRRPFLIIAIVLAIVTIAIALQGLVTLDLSFWGIAIRWLWIVWSIFWVGLALIVGGRR